MNKSTAAAVNIERLQQASEWVQRLNESTEPSSADEWLAWCDSDPLNLAAYEQMQKTWDAFGAPTGRNRRKYAGGLILLAASIVLGVALFGWFFSRPDIQVWDTSVGQTRQIKLSDGSQVDLAPDSRVTTHLTLTRREVRLERGQAFFAVAHSAYRSFVVQVADLTVTSLGTAFDVRTGPTDTVVMVSEGRVSVASGDNDLVRAHVGQQVVFSKTQQKLTVGNLNAGGAGSWRGGTLQFVGEPLEEVASAINRYTLRHVAVSTEFKQTRFTGTLSPPNVGEWLIALEQIYDVKVVDQGSSGILIRARAEGAARP